MFLLLRHKIGSSHGSWQRVHGDKKTSMDLTTNLKVYKSSRMFIKSLPLIFPQNSKIQGRLRIPFTKKENPPIDFGPRVLPPTRHASEALALATTFVTSTPHFLREATSQVVITSHPTIWLVWYLLFRKEKGSLY